VTLVEQWQGIESRLDPNWGDARLALAMDSDAAAERAAALLGPASPGRFGRTVRFFTGRRGGGVGPEAVQRMLRRIDSEKLGGTLELVASDEAPPEPAVARASLAAEWDVALGLLPADWTDLYCEIELTSTDHLDRAALLLSPLNPARFGGSPGYRFRCARSFGYGASPEMVRRCFERLDADGIPGEVRILRALSDTHPAGTQGVVWHVGGRTV
jgi:hypothetical protein